MTKRGVRARIGSPLLVGLCLLPLDPALAQAPPSSDGGSAWDEAVEWTRDRAIPLATTEPGQGFDDLSRLAPSIGSARIVAMGEITHGTREFFRLKHRMFEYLVEEHGFRLFGIEASYAGCLPIDHYVQTGEGDVRALIKGQGFWTWDTEEVFALVEWMRAHNARHDAPEDRVHFYGFDTQDAATPLAVALDALRTFEPDEAKRLGRRLKTATASRYPGVLGDGSMDDYEAVVRAIDELQEGLSRHREALEATELGYDRLLFAAEAGRYAVLSSRPEEVAPGDADAEEAPLRNVRDETMAKVVEWILNHHGDESRIMLWAHDGHVTKHRGDPSQDRPMMGSVLESRFGDDYVPVGFSFAEGDFQALYWPKDGEDWARRVLGVYEIDGVIPGSIDELLSEAGEPRFMLDLRSGADGAVPAWFDQPRVRRRIGGLFDEDDADGPRFVEELVLAEHFELMVFVNTTSRALPLRPPPTFLLGAWSTDADDGGARVTGVADESIADVAGLQAGDIILEVDGSVIEDDYDLSVALSRLNRPGEVAVRILRPLVDGGQETRTLHVEVPTWVGEDLEPARSPGSSASARPRIVASESASLTQTISGTDFEILYSRPSLRGRSRIFGGIHPIGESWTGGANDATELRTSRDIVMGGVKVPAGAYSVWFDVIEGNEWRMMLHEDTAMYHAPHPPIDEHQIILPVSRQAGNEVVETLRWGFEDLRWNGATLALAWGTERLRVDVEVDPGITLTVPEEEAARYIGEWRIDDSMSRMSAERIEEMLSDPEAGESSRQYARAMKDIPTERVVTILYDSTTGWLFRTDPPFAEVWASFIQTDPADERFDLLVPRGEGFFHMTQGVGGQLRSYYPDFVPLAEFRHDDTGRAVSFEVRDYKDEVTMVGVRVGR